MSVPPSRIDPTSPESVAGATFSTARRGFHPDEVRAALRDVAAELRALRARVAELEAELSSRGAEAASAVTFDEETATRLLGEETVRVLQTARESAVQIRARAEETAARILRDATEESARVRSESEVEAARIRGDASRDAEAELSLAKQQGREMVNEARAYRERVLDELARRREAARQQIDQLVHGRDRLLQVFERARLVAVDVVSELEPLVEPEEYVDLSPTTGPVPVMSSPVLPSRRADTDAALVESVVTVESEVTVEPGADVSDAGAESGDVESGDAESADADALEPDAEPADDLDGESVPTLDVEPAAASSTEDVSGGSDDEAEPEGTVEPGANESASAPTGSGGENVIALFGGDRAPAVEPGDGPATDVDATTTTARPDVDGLFARLRAEAIGTGPVESDAPAPETGSSAETAADGAGADAGDAGEDETVFQRRDADLVPLIVAAGRKLKRVLADEQNDVLGALRNPKRSGALLDLLPERDAHVSRYVDAIAAELVEAHRAGARSIDRQAEAPAPDLEPVRDLVSGSLITPLRDRLERADADAGGDAEELIRSVRAVFREWKSQQIDDQLDDVLRLAHGVGILAAATTGTPMCWAVDPAGPACPDAEDNALAGAVPAGDAYPTGHRVAPAHAGCRCVLVPAGK